jgi:hypothetical protein
MFEPLLEKTDTCRNIVVVLRQDAAIARKMESSEFFRRAKNRRLPCAAKIDPINSFGIVLPGIAV